MSSQFTPEISLREQFFSTETATEILKRLFLYQPKFHPHRPLNSNSQLFELSLNQRKLEIGLDTFPITASHCGFWSPFRRAE